MKQLAPILVWLFCAEDVVVALAYFWVGNIRLGLYWLAAASICAAVPK